MLLDDDDDGPFVAACPFGLDGVANVGGGGMGMMTQGLT